MYERVGKGLTQTNGDDKVLTSTKHEDKPLGKQTNDYGEIDIFHSLQKYKDEHNAANLQKLMVEILEFCSSVYSSTRSEQERKIYRSMIEKINK